MLLVIFVCVSLILSTSGQNKTSGATENVPGQCYTSKRVELITNGQFENPTVKNKYKNFGESIEGWSSSCSNGIEVWREAYKDSPQKGIDGINTGQHLELSANSKNGNVTTHFLGITCDQHLQAKARFSFQYWLRKKWDVSTFGFVLKEGENIILDVDLSDNITTESWVGYSAQITIEKGAQYHLTFKEQSEKSGGIHIDAVSLTIPPKQFVSTMLWINKTVGENDDCFNGYKTTNYNKKYSKSSYSTNHINIRQIDVFDRHDKKILVTNCGQQCQSVYEPGHGADKAIDGLQETMVVSKYKRVNECDLDHWLLFHVHADFKDIGRIVIYNRGLENCKYPPSDICPIADCHCRLIGAHVYLEKESGVVFDYEVMQGLLMYDIHLPEDVFRIAVEQLASQICLAIMAGDSAAAAIAIGNAASHGYGQAISVAVAIAVASGEEYAVAEACAKAVVTGSSAHTVSRALAEGVGQPNITDELQHDLDLNEAAAVSGVLAQVSEGRVEAQAQAYAEEISSVVAIAVEAVTVAVSVGTEASCMSAATAIAEAGARAIVGVGAEVNVEGTGQANSMAASAAKAFALAIAKAIAETLVVAAADNNFNSYNLVYALQVTLAANLQHVTAQAEVHMAATSGHSSYYEVSIAEAWGVAIAEALVAAIVPPPTN